MGGIMIKSMIVIMTNFCFVFASAFAADINIDPTELNLKVYKFAVSSSPLCTSLKTVFSTETPTAQNVLSNPNFGSGSLTDGTYPCVAIEFSDNITYKPNANSDTGNCVSGATSTLDVCSSGSSTMIDGTTTTCTAAENRVTMFLSTASTQTNGGDAFTPPTVLGDSTKGFKLTAALTVSGATAGTFVVNGTDKIADQGGNCEMNAPLFSFVP